MKHALTTATILLSLALTGCGSSSRIAKTNDKLRREREDLREMIQRVEDENAELEAKIAELKQQDEAAPTDEILAALPRVAGIELTRFSTVWTEGGASEIRFFLVPKDGKGRFVQAVGTLHLRAVATGAEGTEPELLVERTITPAELRDAYTMGLGGVSYLFEIPVTTPVASSIALRAEFHDAVTGATHEAERLIETETGSSTEQQ